MTGERGAYTVAEAAAWLGRSDDTVRRLIDDGTLPAVKVRGTNMIARTALERLVDPTLLDLRAISTDELALIVEALGTLPYDDVRARCICRLRERLVARLAYAEALAAPIAAELEQGNAA